jgi:hypothetical protein
VFAQSGYGTTTIYDTNVRELPADSTVFELPPYQLWDRQPWSDSVYRFPEFQPGKLEFANGFSPSTRLNVNYNIFLETIDVKDEKGIGILKKFPELKIIYIGETKFVYNPSLGYLEIILDGNISVAKRTVMAAVVGLSNGFKYRMTGMDVKSQTYKATRYYWPIELYYILDSDYKPHRAGSLVLPTMLPSIKHKIKDFVRINDISYRDKEDILKVVRYCNENYSGPVHSENPLLVLRIPAKTSIMQSAWKDSVYRFNGFQEALISFESGSKRETIEVDYNLVTGWFDTRDKTGDTLALSTGNRIKIANVDGVAFLNDGASGLVEILMHGKIGLGLKKRIVLQGESNANVDSLVAVYLIPREKVYYLENTYYFIRKERCILANARTLMSLFPGRKEEITKYISTYDPDFSSKKDLMDLLTYCTQL